ncbi:MBL fold metallo-hydrolase [Corynebacterium felinum]|uniref:Glyoxylase-like metal-dependent hydrolase (Beta-lactamase superfamily II) n=1 Tax=Corynebacterium felinum TaxID=131318 RepID=A0ABU2BB25_9CORY|nr:MBL fold metallo-hydrolase [Corynebacterium felinum]MDF5820458.1 MBL fold metallo-hydrolase [Corynebacterium felinum]MDR7355496.1 glyoxylase-like metal-dependent hydrolase (beta-lactamase superfamily II) [Corynebacterium felinum]WJY94847.1 putative metallo-hydrolase [Corynebacterium felinum]
MKPLTLNRIAVDPFDNNCYFVCAGDEALLIDAANNAPALLKRAEELQVRITHLLTTHRHADHVQALAEVLAATGATHFASALDAPSLPVAVDVKLEHGDVLPFAGYEFPVIVLRGHTEGGAALVVELDGVTNIFVGDSLFPGGVGKTDSPEHFEQLFSDVTTRLFDVYDDDTVIWPGHGANTTLGAERGGLDEWKQRGW